MDEDDSGEKLLDAQGNETVGLKQMIAMYAGGMETESDGQADSSYALQVLKEIEDSEGTAECMLCMNEIFDEVLLPCYHRGWAEVGL